ncbi:MAG TPA: exodeoxyribonuclease VII large subunit [bacterium]|nr:exodeoxyribonuclease VII large subunit [bacterium]
MIGASKEAPLSVSELTAAVKAILEESMGRVWVKGEISNYSSPASGHVYFTLKDENNQVKVAMFRGGSRKSSLEDGQKVAVFGRVSIYGKRSEYQIIAEEIQVTGIGELLVEFEKLKKKLAEEGLFDEKRKRPIPRFPEKIAIVTSPTGAVIKDIINVISRRYRAAELLVYPVMVQGDAAPARIIGAIRALNKMEGIDVIILARGGGSIEDLWAFNDEKLAHVIYGSETPIISAIGHEVDYTIADFTADLRAPTPSAAAEIVVPDSRELYQALKTSRSRLSSGLTSIVKSMQERLDRLKVSYGFKKPFDFIEEYSRRFDDLSDDIGRAASELVGSKEEKTKQLSEKLGLLNPLNILKKGYAVVYGPSGRIVKESSALKPGSRVKARFHKGSIDAEVKKTSDKNG